MRQKNKYYVCIACVLTAWWMVTMCKPKVEHDISSQTVTLTSPTAPSIVGYTQTFKWDKVDGAVTYQLIIASPSFETVPDSIYLDTVVYVNQFTFTVGPGNYEWKVNARNGSSKTIYTSAKFTMNISPINALPVILSEPVNEGYTNADSVDFSWLSLYVIDKYELQLSETADFSGSMIKDTFIYSPHLDCKIPLKDETAYYWRVKAIKSDTSSLWSNTRSLTYDTTAPAQVVLSSPLDSAVNVAAVGNLEWTSLSLSNDITYNVTVSYGDSTVTIPKVATNSYAYSAKAGQKITWKVQAEDLAGNLGQYSNTWFFTVLP
ncbi:MAG TPA: hypothetical protein VK750_08275 [Cytophagaceae bacterium]|jgi:hypothetical protein|nr:hypothetical protein [Cytophagaceae bacterium]